MTEVQLTSQFRYSFEQLPWGNRALWYVREKLCKDLDAWVRAPQPTKDEFCHEQRERLEAQIVCVAGARRYFAELMRMWDLHIKQVIAKGDVWARLSGLATELVFRYVFPGHQLDENFHSWPVYALQVAVSRGVSLPYEPEYYEVLFPAADNSEAFDRIVQAYLEAPQDAWWTVAQLRADGCDITDALFDWSNGLIQAV